MTLAPLPLQALLRAPVVLPRVLADARGRVKRKLRISMTDRCNFRCVYCMPERPRWLPKDELLSREELGRLVRLFVVELGITQLRVTGGEPLLRRDLAECIADFDALRPRGLERISLTSNGTRLAAMAARLRAAGVDDVNVSLDARTPEVFRALTGAGIEPVLRGIAAARAVGLAVKINTVLVRGYNEAEVLPLARWAVAEGLPLRFIEFMPLDGRGGWSRERVVTEEQIVQQLAPHFRVERLARGSDPATAYRLDGQGALGIISTISNPFCASCDRVRLAATGELYSCLFSKGGVDLRTVLRAGADDAALLSAVRGHIWRKEGGYAERAGYVDRPLTMHHLGG